MHRNRIWHLYAKRLYNINNHVLTSSWVNKLIPEQKFLHYHTSIDNCKYSFFPRTIPEWNGLPQDIINQQTIDSFKQLLYNHF